MTSVLEVEDLTVVYGRRSRRREPVVAVNRVTFSVEEGTTFGLVGESGSGKTTVGRAILGLIRPTAGRVTVAGSRVRPLSLRAAVAQGRSAQVIFQDPLGSLNPARRVVDSVSEPIRIYGGLRGDAAIVEVERLGTQVNLPPTLLRRLPHQLSGGQCQRAAVARAIASRPKLVVCDEPVTALDVSTQAQVINLLADLQEETDVAYLFISHDISVVRHVSDRVGVMYAGQLVEVGDCSAITDRPTHPYTRALLLAVPMADPKQQRGRRDERRAVAVGADDLRQPVTEGCPYRLRCPMATTICAAEAPALRPLADGRLVACHHASEVSSWEKE